ncbi:cytochrome c3 family protein [Xanthobacter autotrophicus DSM 431]|uniref:cytochrome c3 family protein n=1 Tax=Xanthobacter nonsaccharivorans TaxID=3119912 RepID=UPI00372BE807
MVEEASLSRIHGTLAPLAIGLASALAILAGGFLSAGANTPPAMAGSQSCAGCHAAEAESWRKSQHAAAMQHAREDTVLGDFGGVDVDYFGIRSRFFREDGKFLVTTDGPDGAMGTFEVKYTFGVDPLQQYLVEFPDGRIQALPFAWDSRPKAKGGQRWFHLYPGEQVRHDDSLHWTKLGQNWNFMCAECHSTGVRKNYEAASDTFHTTFSEISVGCESCHGAASGHIAWAKGGADPRLAGKGFASMAPRRPPPDWTINPATGSPAHGTSRPAGDEVETCARCHGRRGAISENWQPGHPITDTHMPALLSADLFEDDGQMRDEVFNDQSFKQSLMYAKGVVCSDCHDPHSGKLKAEGAEVCGQCHAPERFASTAHTGHAPGPGAPDCISCHMPARTYMGVDARHDHSFRVPRPDLSETFNTPNACTGCHADKPPRWAAEAVERWHGPVRKGFQSWTEAFHKARAAEPAARELLLKLAANPEIPGIARATALSEAQRFPSNATSEATAKALSDADPMVRVVALRALAGAPLPRRWELAAPLLGDPVLAVRTEAALLLADQPLGDLAEADRIRLTAAMAEYEAAQRLNADRPDARANLARFLASRGDPVAAEAELLAGLRLYPGSTTLSVNLADIYRALGREADAEAVLREAIARAPEAGAAHHALGLSLVRQKRYAEALAELRRGTELAPDEPRFAYVYAVALQSTGQSDQVKAVVAEALRRHPYDGALLTLALKDALRQSNVETAADLAGRLSQMQPDDASLSRLADRLKGR